MGLGHLARCLPLAKRFQMAGAQPYFAGNYSELAISLLKHRQFSYNQKTESDFFDHLKKFPVLVTDSYLIEDSFSDKIPEEVYWIAFDDFSEFKYPKANEVINFRINAENLYDYDSKHQSLGVSYFFVDRMWDKLKTQTHTPSQYIKKIFACFGAASLATQADNIITELAEFFPEAKLIYLSDSTKKFPENVCTQNLMPNFYNEILHSDLVVCAGGRMKYEACYSGYATASYSLNDGQLQDSINFDKHSMIYNLNNPRDQNFFNSIADKKTRHQKSEKCREIFSGSDELQNELIQRVVSLF